MDTKNYGKGRAMKILSYREADQMINKLVQITSGRLDYPSRAKIANIRKKQEACVALTEQDKEILMNCLSRADVSGNVKQYEAMTYNT